MSNQPKVSGVLAHGAGRCLFECRLNIHTGAWPYDPADLFAITQHHERWPQFYAEGATKWQTFTIGHLDALQLRASNEGLIECWGGGTTVTAPVLPEFECDQSRSGIDLRSGGLLIQISQSHAPSLELPGKRPRTAFLRYQTMSLNQLLSIFTGGMISSRFGSFVRAANLILSERGTQQTDGGDYASGDCTTPQRGTAYPAEQREFDASA